MKEVVFLVGSYYPKYSATGKCIGNIADEMAKSNSIRVVSWATCLDEVENSKCFYNKQTIFRTYNILHYFHLKSLHLKQSRNPIKQYLGSMIFNLCRLWRLIFMLNNDSSVNKAVLEAYKKSLADIDEHIDVIIPTCLSFETVLAAVEYKKNNPQVKIIPIVFDKFADNASLARGERSKQHKFARNLELEEEMFEKSEAVLYVANWREHIKKYFPQYLHKTVEIEHPLLLPYALNEEHKDVFDNRSINIVYAGSITKRDRNPAAIICLLEKLYIDDILVHFFSLGNAKYMIDNASRKHPQLFKSHGYISHNRLVDVLNSADILLSIGSIAEQVSAKVFEYISYGKPIIHFAYSEGDPVISVLEKYSLGKIVKVSECSSESKKEEVRDFIMENYTKRIAYEEVLDNFENATPEYTVAIIENIIRSGVSCENK